MSEQFEAYAIPVTQVAICCVLLVIGIVYSLALAAYREAGL